MREKDEVVGVVPGGGFTAAYQDGTVRPVVVFVVYRAPDQGYSYSAGQVANGSTITFADNLDGFVTYLGPGQSLPATPSS